MLDVWDQSIALQDIQKSYFSIWQGLEFYIHTLHLIVLSVFRAVGWLLAFRTLVHLWEM